MIHFFSFSSVMGRPAAIGTSIALLLGTMTPLARAAGEMTHYSDVPAGVWYEASAAALLSAGALDPNEPELRADDPAIRAEMIKLLVRTHDLPLRRPQEPSFDDVRTWAWYYPYIETAAIEEWVRGDNNCYHRLIPCTARPLAKVNRAEAAALLVRAFNLESTGDAPVFSDNRRGEWYFNPIQTAADHCILQGDDLTRAVRPGSDMLRSEMIVMMHRASQRLTYGEDCGPTAEPPQVEAQISSATVLSDRMIRLVFSEDLDGARAGEEWRYRVERVSNDQSVEITEAIVQGRRTIDLKLGSALASNIFYRVTASNLLLSGGGMFTDTALVRLEGEPQQNAEMTSVEVRSLTRLRVSFNTDLDPDRTEERFRYLLSGIDGAIEVRSAILIDARTVELTLQEEMEMQAQYSLSASGLLTSQGTIFSDSTTFVNNLDSVTFVASLRGIQEVPPTLSPAVGTGTFTLTPNGLSYDITVQNLQGVLTSAHFHLGREGVSGPVIEPITFSGNRATGIWTGLSQEERNQLLDGEIYVNVHTDVYPNGEIRGQVLKN